MEEVKVLAGKGWGGGRGGVPSHFILRALRWEGWKAGEYSVCEEVGEEEEDRGQRAAGYMSLRTGSLTTERGHTADPSPPFPETSYGRRF